MINCCSKLLSAFSTDGIVQSCPAISPFGFIACSAHCRSSSTAACEWLPSIKIKSKVSQHFQSFSGDHSKRSSNFASRSNARRLAARRSVEDSLSPSYGKYGSMPIIKSCGKFSSKKTVVSPKYNPISQPIRGLRVLSNKDKKV